MSEARNQAKTAVKTAFLIVHGVGQQNRFETLSGFAAGLANHVAASNNARDPTIERLLQNHAGRNESLLRLHLELATECPERPDHVVDICEYYYQPMLQRTVSVEDVIDWLLDASEHIRSLYKCLSKNDLSERSQSDSPCFVRNMEDADGLDSFHSNHSWIDTKAS